MKSKHSLLLPLAALALGLSAASQSQAAAIVVTLPTASVAGSIVITHDINFTLTDTANSGIGSMVLVLDEWVTNDGTTDSVLLTSPFFHFAVNNVMRNPSGSFSDNGSAIGSVSANDGVIGFSMGGPIVMGDTLTVQAETYTLPAGSAPASFNPSANQTFMGNVFLADGTRARMSANVSLASIPEPGSAALGALAGLALLRRRRR